MALKNTFLVRMFVLLVVLSLLSVLGVSAQGDDDLYTYKLTIPSEDNFCNCDDDCSATSGGMDGCLTEESSAFLRNLNGLWDNYVEDAHDEGYNGICAKLFFANQQTPYQMTTDCSLQFEVEEEPEPEPEPEPEEEEEDPAEDVIDAISGSTTDGTIEKTEEDSNSSKEGETMEITSAQLIAFTVMVIGFFGLMGWIAYLLQK